MLPSTCNFVRPCCITAPGSVQLYDGYVAPMDDALLGLSEVAPGIADSFASSTSAANTFLIVFGLFGFGR